MDTKKTLNAEEILKHFIVSLSLRYDYERGGLVGYLDIEPRSYQSTKIFNVELEGVYDGVDLFPKNLEAK